MKRLLSLLIALVLVCTPLLSLATEETPPDATPVPSTESTVPPATLSPTTPPAAETATASAAASDTPTPGETADPTASHTTTPSATLESEETPAHAAEQLEIDTDYIYSGMERSYAKGYMPTTKDGKALLILPLMGDTLDGLIRVTPEIATDGPFVYGNYQFDVEKSSEPAIDERGETSLREIYLVTLELALAKSRYNGTYPVNFKLNYTDTSGALAEQSFTLQVIISDGKTQSTGGGGGGGPTAVKKPVLWVSNSGLSAETIEGGQGFSLSCDLVNLGDRDAKNIKVWLDTDSAQLYRTDGLNAVFIASLNTEETQSVSFELSSDKTLLAGRHSITLHISYEDKYGGSYSESSTLAVNVVQPVSIGYDEVKLPKSITSGESFLQLVCVFNEGFAPVYNVRCVLEVDGLIAASAYLGNLEPQQSADKAMSVFVTTLSGSAKYGESYGSMVISYQDAEGIQYEEYLSVSTNIIEPVVETDEEKLKQEQEQKEQQTLSQWWISMLIAVAIILVLVSGILITRFSRMLKMK